MKEITLATFQKIKCMAKGYLFGLIQENIQVNIKMIKNMVMENFFILMVDFIKVIGLKECSMEMV